jgi:hypothetical protein
MSNRVEATVEVTTFIDRSASTCFTCRASMPSTVKVTMPHCSAPISRTVTPGISSNSARNLEASDLTRSQMAAIPHSRA